VIFFIICMYEFSVEVIVNVLIDTYLFIYLSRSTQNIIDYRLLIDFVIYTRLHIQVPKRF